MGAIVTGRNTYEDYDRFDGGGPHPTASLFVLSHRPAPEMTGRQALVTTGIEDAVAAAPEAARHKEGGQKGGGVVTGASKVHYGWRMAYLSTPDDLALHGVRVMGFATAARVAGRFGLDTDADGHGAFRPLNRRFGEACTDWQMRPTGSDPMAVNDHTDWRWDERVLRTLESCDDALRHLCDRLSRCLVRYDGYADLYSSARRKVDAGERAWLDASDRDWCHMVWMQFHEDLLATLGLDRGTDNLA